MKAKSLFLILAVGLLAASSGAEPVRRKGFFWGGGLGGGWLDRSFSHTNGVDDAEARFYMEFFGGYAFNPHIAVGLEIGGWLIEPSSETYVWNPYWPPDNERSEDPTGEGLMQVLAFTRLYPWSGQGLFIKLGGGYLERWIETSGGTYNEEGWSAVAGLGWDLHVSGNWSLTPTISYSLGEAGSQTHQAVTLSLSLMWHQWKGPDRFAQMNAEALSARGEEETYPQAVKRRFLTAWQAQYGGGSP
jgi:hypothetical protein